MKKLIMILLVLFGATQLTFAQDSAEEKEEKKKIVELTMLNIDFKNTENLAGDEGTPTTFAAEALGGYVLFKRGELDNPDLYRKAHGFALNGGLRLSSFETNDLNLSSTSFAGSVYLGGGYGAEYNNITGYATLNTSVFSVFSSDFSGETVTDSEFLPDNSGFLRLAVTWKPFYEKAVEKGKKQTFGLHAAWDNYLAEGGGSAFTVGIVIQGFAQ